jgi:hypothetical protein
MEYIVNGAIDMFATLLILFIVLSIIEAPEIWQLLLYIVLSPLWLFYKLLKYPIQEKK